MLGARRLFGQYRFFALVTVDLGSYPQERLINVLASIEDPANSRLQRIPAPCGCDLNEAGATKNVDAANKDTCHRTR